MIFWSNSKYNDTIIKLPETIFYGYDFLSNFLNIVFFMLVNY